MKVRISIDATKTKRTKLYTNKLQCDVAITSKCEDSDLLPDTAGYSTKV